MLSPLRRLVGAAACLLLAVAGAPTAHATDGDVAYTWNDPRLAAPSGMTSDADHTVYWVTSSGASASAFYAVRPDGSTAARMVVNASTAAVEAIGYRGGRVFLGDIGDPTRARKKVTVAVAAVSTVADATLPYRLWDFTYADGAHDAEAMLIGDGDRIYVITTGASPGVYQAPATLVTTRSNVLTRIADAPADVTDATYLPSGRVAMRTPTDVYEVDPASWQTVAQAALPPQQRGKSLTTSLDGPQLLASGQGSGTAVVKVAFPSAPKLDPTPATVPTPSETPAPEATQPPTSQRSDSSGTIVALVAAGLLAMIAAAYTLIRR